MDAYSTQAATMTTKGLVLLCLLPILGVRGQMSSSCPRPCSCERGRVDCSNRELTTSSLPAEFPPDTTELSLHDNLLTTLPNGLLDSLASLHSVSLHGNPWACDCGVLYLRAWLRRQPDNNNIDDRRAHLNVSCSSPPGLRGRLVVYLTEEEVLETCHYWYCDLAVASQVCLFVFVVVQALLLVAVIVFLKRFEKFSKEARRTTEESLAGGEGLLANEYEPVKG